MRDDTRTETIAGVAMDRVAVPVCIAVRANE